MAPCCILVCKVQAQHGYSITHLYKDLLCIIFIYSSSMHMVLFCCKIKSTPKTIQRAISPLFSFLPKLHAKAVYVDTYIYHPFNVVLHLQHAVTCNSCFISVSVTKVCNAVKTPVTSYFLHLLK